MAAPSNFAAFIGNPRAVRILQRALEGGRVPHALIFSGPEGVGKKTLALLLAKRLNCLSPTGGDSCAACNSCRKIAAGHHPDVRVVEPEGAYIKVEQVRAINAEVHYQPFEGRFRAVIFDPADQMRAEAANSLLKTLEEPASRTVLVLVTSQYHLLLPTIRSRSQVLQFTAIPEDRITRHLAEAAGIAAADARLAAALSGGSLGAALRFDAAAYREVRGQAMRFVSLLLAKGSFADASRLIAGLPKERDPFRAWLDVVDALLQEVYYVRAAPGRVSRADAIEDILELAGRTTRPAVVSAIHSFRNLRRATAFNVNRQIALESLFLTQVGGQEWRPDTAGR
jgi:DNA polymerase-3 subunit delta'